MEKEKNKKLSAEYYDAIIHITVVNLYTLSKEKNKIILKNFNRKDLSHKCILRIARIMNVLGEKTEIILPPFKYWLYKNILCRSEFGDNWLLRSKEEEGIDINQIVSDMETANKDIGVFLRIYNKYFNKHDHLHRRRHIE